MADKLDELHDRVNATIIRLEREFGLIGASVERILPYVFELHGIVEDAFQEGHTSLDNEHTVPLGERESTPVERMLDLALRPSSEKQESPAFRHGECQLREVFDWYAGHKDGIILHESTRGYVERLLGEIREALDEVWGDE